MLRLATFATALAGAAQLAWGADITSGMVGHWTFDEGTGATAHDSSGSGNDASLVGNPSWTPAGKFGGAIVLSGTTADYLQVTSPVKVPIGNSPRTIAAWVKWSGIELLPGPKYQAIVSYGTGANAAWCSLERGGDPTTFYKRLFIDTWSGTSGVINDFGGNTADAFPAGQWTHVAMTYSGSLTKLYLNGQLDASGNIPFNTVLSSSGLMIGNSTWRNDGWHVNFAGLIDDVFLYDRTLSASELQQLMFMSTQNAFRITAIAAQTNKHVILQCIGVPNQSHTVQASSNLTQPFTALSTAVAGADGTFQYEDASADSVSVRFYRIAYP